MPASFGEHIAPGFWSRFEGEALADERSPFQRIQIFDTESFGRTLVLDGLVQTTESDEFCYHEMLTHPPLLMLDQPRAVLIIGGGDGGTLRHVLMHPSVERALMIEIDERVTALCRTHLPALAGEAFDDPRAEVRFADGIAFIKDTDERFDAIIVDSSDPVGPGEGLFTEAFYADAAARLAPGGIVTVQSGSPLFQQAELNRAHRAMATALPDVRTYLGIVPTYPGALWSYTMGSSALEPGRGAQRAAERGIDTRYWSPALQAGAFALPAFMTDVLAPGGPAFAWGKAGTGVTVPGQ